jgi:hypothetical protein
MAEMNILRAAECAADSWSPEVISLYGDAEIIIDKLGGIKRELTGRRVYIFTPETARRAEIAYYESTIPGKVSTHRWSGQSDDSFHNAVHKAIMDNKGVHRVGEQTKAIVSKLPRLAKEEEISAPVNAKAAFSHQVRSHGNEYLRVTIYLMCWSEMISLLVIISL